MIQFKTGNIFEDFGPGSILVHGCNAQGKMNSGIAKQVRELYPKAYDDYRISPMLLGDVIFSDVGGKVVANAITQLYYGYDGKAYASYDALKSCLKKVREFQDTTCMKVILPEICCGLGGLSKEIVFDIIEEIFEDCIVYSLKGQ